MRVLLVSSAALALAPAAATGALPAAATAGGWYKVECRSFKWKATKGIWPENHKITQATRWCWGKKRKRSPLVIKSHSSTDGFSSGPMCDITWGPKTWVYAGGVGYFFVAKKTKAVFSCGFTVKVSSTVSMRIVYNAWGWTYEDDGSPDPQ